MFFFVYLAILFIIYAADHSYVSGWSSFYFRHGLPLYRKKYVLEDISTTTLQDHQLLGYSYDFAREIPQNNRGSFTDFNIINKHELAFRVTHKRLPRRTTSEKSFGMVRFNKEQKIITITGYFAWYELGILLFPFLFYISLGMPPIDSVMVIAAIPFALAYVWILSNIYGHRAACHDVSEAVRHTFYEG